ncbi:MAG: hypothetical protein MI919_33640, partial [Holophagales bacterium]|nr:hypothetical protein [Holophagales bacterium]
MRLGRGRLRELRGELEAWHGVPPSARAFHRARRLLEEDLEEQEGRIFSWSAGEAMTELEERAARLRPVAEGLGGLFRRRDEANALLAGLAGRNDGEAAADPADLSRWRVALARTGEGVRSLADIELERRQLEELWAEVITARDRSRLRSAPAAPVPAPDPPPVPGAATPVTPPTTLPTPPPPPSGPGALSRPRSRPRQSPAQDPADLQRLEASSRQLWDWARVVPGT